MIFTLFFLACRLLNLLTKERGSHPKNSLVVYVYNSPCLPFNIRRKQILKLFELLVGSIKVYFILGGRTIKNYLQLKII